MSTKTSIKRIALVAVAALGFGMVSTVAANAGESSTGVVTDVLVTSAGTSVAVSTNNLFTLNVKHGVVGTANDTITIKGAVISKPAGAAITFATPTKPSNITASATKSGVTYATTGSSASLAVVQGAYANDTAGTPGLTHSNSASLEAPAGAGEAFGTVNFQADTAGSYTIRFWNDANSNGTSDSGEQYVEYTLTVLAAGSQASNVTASTNSVATNIWGTNGTVAIGTIAPVRTATAFRVPVVITPATSTAWGASSSSPVLDSVLTVTSAPSSAVVTCSEEATGTYSAANCSNLGIKINASATSADGYIDVASKTTGYAADGVTADPTKDTWTAYYWVKVDTAGTYLFDVSATDAAGTPVTKTTAASTTVTTRGVASTITLTPLTTTPSVDSAFSANTSAGTSVIVSLKDANGYATVPSATDSLTISVSGPTGFRASNATPTTAGSAITSLAASDFYNSSSGYGTFVLQATAAGSGTVTVSGLNGIGNTVTGSATVTFSAATVAPDSSNDAFANGASYTGYTSITSSAAYVSPSKTSISVALNTSNASGDITALQYVDTSGLKYGIANVFYSATKTLSTGGDLAAVSIPLFAALTNGAVMTVRIIGTSSAAAAASLTLTGQTAVPNSTLSAFDATTINAAPAAAISAGITVKDQFGLVLPSQTLTFAVAGGRNTVTANLTQITDAAGRATFSYTDAGTTGTDTISVSPAVGSLSNSVSVNYNAANVVGSVLLDSDDYTAGVSNGVITPKPIAVGATGAQTGYVTTVKATVTTAAGTALQGVACTWSVAGTGAAIMSTYVTTYTSSLGVCSTRVYAWKTGTYTITATAGGKSGTATESFNSVNTTDSTAGNERTITASASGNKVTATATDRFGNPVVNAKIYAKITAGDGNIGGLVSTSAYTDNNGQAFFIVQGGNSTVTVSNISFAAAAGTIVGQTSAAKGYDIGGVNATALTAYVAGTTATAETGVGSTYDAAGVATATADAVVGTTASDSVDAANEATDAANAATDAANAAAEAADAATAAAQDAQAAVAALASQVADLIAGIKAQITALTNLVIKIQKKVKA